MSHKTVVTGSLALLSWLCRFQVAFAGTANQAAGTTAANVALGTTNASVSSLANVGGNPVWVAMKLFLSLGILIILVIFTIRFLAKRTGLGRPQGDVQVLAARQLAPGKSVQVIETYGQRLLVGVGDQVTVLATLEQTEQSGDSFAELLTERLESLRGKHTEGESTQQ